MSPLSDSSLFVHEELQHKVEGWKRYPCNWSSGSAEGGRIVTVLNDVLCNQELRADVHLYIAVTYERIILLIGDEISSDLRSLATDSVVENLDCTYVYGSTCYTAA